MVIESNDYELFRVMVNMYADAPYGYEVRELENWQFWGEGTAETLEEAREKGKREVVNAYKTLKHNFSKRCDEFDQWIAKLGGGEPTPELQATDEVLPDESDLVVKTLHQVFIEDQVQLRKYDLELGRHLGDGWEILNISVVVTQPDPGNQTTQTDRVILLRRNIPETDQTEPPSLGDLAKEVRQMLMKADFYAHQFDIMIEGDKIVVQYNETLDGEKFVQAVPEQFRDRVVFKPVSSSSILPF
jgi:hypothetical protein